VPSLRHYIKVNTAALRRPQAGELRPSIDELLARNAPANLSGFHRAEVSASFAHERQHCACINPASFWALWIICHAQTIRARNANGDAVGANLDEKPKNNQKLILFVRLVCRHASPRGQS
jgi:hypothetical protein